MLILRSGEHQYWDYPREIVVPGVFPGGGAGLTGARAEPAKRVPHAPLHLALIRRDGQPWRALKPGERADVALWEFDDDALNGAWSAGAFHPPTRNPSAWCTVVDGDLDSELADWTSHQRAARVTNQPWAIGQVSAGN